MFNDSIIDIKNDIQRIYNHQNNLWNKFHKHMGTKTEANISFVIEDYWDHLLDDYSFDRFRQYIKNFTHTNDDDIDTNTRLSAHYWSQHHKCTCDRISPCCPNCHDSKIWFAIDLERIFSIELFRYELIIGGPKHGNFIINSNHPLNDNEEDIVINILEHHEKFHFIDDFKNSIQTQYDELEKYERNITDYKTNLTNHIVSYKLEEMIKLFDKMKVLYPDMIGYNSKSKRNYNSIKQKTSELICEADKIIVSNADKNSDISTLCQSLINSISTLNDDMEIWFNLINKHSLHIFCNDIQKYICDFI